MNFMAQPDQLALQWGYPGSWSKDKQKRLGANAKHCSRCTPLRIFVHVSSVQPIAPADVFRPCPVCGATEAEAYFQKQALRLVCCPACTMIYANPVKADYVSGAYYDKEAAGYYLTPAKLESDYADVRFERELRLFHRHCQSGAVLDVGCSSGGFLYQLNRRFPGAYQVLGTDASGPALDYAASRGVSVLRGNFVTQEFGERIFDAVTFWAVLEHLSNPKAFLERACALLRQGGLCFVLVPNMNSLNVRILGARYRYIYPQHLNYFTRATLTRIAAIRFEVVQIDSTHWNPVVLWQDWRSGGEEVSNEARAALLERTTAYKKRPLLKPAKLIYRVFEKCLGALALADNLVVVLRKS